MTFTLDATPEPLHVPPRVALTATEDDTPEVSLQSVAFFRDGVPLRFEAVVSGEEAIAYDYDAPFDVALLYRADGVEVGSPIDWTEDWASAADWTGSDWTVGAGVVTSSGSGSVIYRDISSGSIINVAVTSPSNMTLELTDAADVVVVSVLVSPDGTVTLSGSTASKVTGSGSFTLSLSSASVTIAGTGWSTTVPFTGVPTRVRLVGPQAGTYVSKFGSTGTTDGKFNNPRAMAIDGSGNIFVADYGNNRVQKFDSSGVYLSQFGSAGTGNGQFDGPTAIAFDGSGNIFVADWFNNRVQKFDSSGVYLSQFGTVGTGNGQFQNPAGLVIDGSSNIFVADSGNNRVQKFNSSGVYQSQFGTFGTGNGQFSNPQYVTLDGSGNIYVADTGNYRVQKFNSSGVYQSQFGTNGAGDGEFSGIYALAFDGSGNIFVTDSLSSTDRVQKFNSSGVYQSQFGSSGTGDGQFGVLYALAFDASGDLYVADGGGNNRVQKFTLDPGSTDDIAVRIDDGDGPIDVTSSDTATVTGVEGAWLTNAAVPELSVLVDAYADVTQDYYIERSTAEETEIPTNSVGLEIEGSADVLTVSTGPRKKERWPLVVATTTVAARRELLAALANDAPISLRFPGTGYEGLDGGFYTVGDLAPKRIGHPKLGSVTVLVLPLTPSRAPKFKPLWQWNMDALAQTGMSMDDVNAAYTSMTDLLIGPT
jgi:sugar lactone lactonase YvrE